MITIVSDLFLTDSFLIKGEVERKYARLSTLLDEHRRYFVKIRNATLVDLNTCDRIQTPLLHVNMDEILLAHEFLDQASDLQQQQLFKDQKTNKVRVFFTGHLNVEVGGECRPGAYEVDDRMTRRFFVLKNPSLRGFNAKDDEDLKLLAKMPYVIVNKTRLSYIYDFNEG